MLFQSGVVIQLLNFLLSILQIQNEGGKKAVWPDLAKFRHFGKLLKDWQFYDWLI